jgi:urease accessory protein
MTTVTTTLTPRKSVLRATARQVDNHTILTERYHDAPLKITKTFYEEQSGRLQLYIMDVSPGLLDGDFYELNLQLEDYSHLIVTNQSFTKIHPTPLQSAQMSQSLHLGKGAVLEYFPEPTIPYAGSRFDGRIKVQLDEAATFLYADIVTPGRTHRGEQFQYVSFTSRFEVYRQYELIAWDQYHLEPAIHQYQSFGAMEDYTHSGTFWVINDYASQALLDQIRSLLPDPLGDKSIIAGVSLLAGGHGIVIRMLAHNVWQLQALVQIIWDECRISILDLPPCPFRK